MLVRGVSLAAAQTPPKPASKATAKPAANDEHLYRNPTFGFRFEIPYGWVDRTRQMQERESVATPDGKPADAAQDKTTPLATRPDNPRSDNPRSANPGELLLALFERPPEVTGDTVNSAVVIAAESAAAYPGLKKAEDYLATLTELTTAKGFKPEGDPEIAEIDGRRLVRANFTKSLTSAKDDKLTMRQSTLILLTKGQIVSFTFIAATEDEIDDLMDDLHFAPSR